MINKITLLFLLTMSTLNAQITFEWETAVDNGDNVSETISGITATLSGLPDIDIVNCGGCFGSTNNLVVSQLTTNGTSVTFTFSEPSEVTSILAIDGNGSSIDYTFTPTGGSNSAVVASLISGSASVNLNWTDVTSFTITSSGSLFGFDNLVVNSSLSTPDYSVEAINIFPNPVENILHIENSININSLNVFNQIGQLVIESKNKKLDFSNLSKGLYILSLETETGIITKKIVKK